MVSILAESNDLIEETAGAEINRLGEELRQMGNELNSRDQGEVEKKLQKISAQAEKVNRALNGWLVRLNSAISEKGKQLQAALIDLDAVARLEEPPVADARNLLTDADYLSAHSINPGVRCPDGSVAQW